MITCLIYRKASSPRMRHLWLRKQVRRTEICQQFPLRQQNPNCVKCGQLQPHAATTNTSGRCLLHKIPSTGDQDHTCPQLNCDSLCIQHITENLLPILKLLDAIAEKDSLPLRGRRLGDDALNLGVGHVDNDKGREDVVEASHHVAFNDLRHDVGNKRLLLYLYCAQSSGIAIAN